MGQAIMVGMAELRVTRGSGDVLVALGLGSCIGVCAYDAMAGVAGMAHVVLPASVEGAGEAPGKYADTAVPALFAAMKKAGASPSHMLIAIAGGAQLFQFGGQVARLDIGRRNAAAVLQALRVQSARLIAEDVGGTVGRTVSLRCADGAVVVKTLGQGERELATLVSARRAELARAA
ncbi:MAG TPA: hypothetical protein VLH79_14055 [Chthonomonadales bacterium]|nr:hypothetical protein [Chthonomonadales bacterium]